MGASQSNNGQNVLLLGLEGSGKTSIVARLLREDPRTVLPTLGNAMRAFSLDGGRHVMKLWDVGGSAAMRSYWPAYYSKAHAIAFVIDSADRRRLAETSAVLQQVLDADELLGLPLLLLASKQDAPGAIPASEIEVLLKLGSIRDRSWRCIECSALTGVGIEAGLRWLKGESAPRATLQRGGSSINGATSPAAGRVSSWRSRASRDLGSAERRGGDKDNEEGESNSPRGDEGRANTRSRSARRGLTFGGRRGGGGGGASDSEDDGESATAPSDATAERGGGEGGRSKTRAQRQAERRQAAASASNDSD